MNKIPVTVLVPIKNEEVNLRKSLPLLTDFDQLIILDSQSADESLHIAESYGAEFHQFYWDGKFPKKRNWALRNININNEWVLFLDADEYITPEFIAELKVAITRTDVNGYWIVFRNYFMGKQLKHGDQFKKLPLFRKGSGEYERIAEDSWSHLDMEVHEHPILDGKVGNFNSHIEHNDYKGLEHYIAKHNSYSSWEARRFIKLQETGFVDLNSRQRLKYRLIGWGLMPLAYFIGNYFLKLGFLDGRAGYYFSKYKSQYFFQIQTKIKELQQ
ncbi:glycosyltransferase family 2 protein [Leeuwenhoekiella aestuarii]|uniref:Glycosyltransferase involved in cell wall biosynthesis n=1 Tax=Leeuwenhoekiella aestuarii TaxID=2249426 RepID=A0A4Q0NR33_9FLAO|nr:glycosyltransferase family 2 protein [Leeuwenhoekiella aestuarii]RXG13102.1 glycosyltransferase involved in cell wall biosynthesis [Leeuwenhoekiella aestuarii]